MSPSLTEPIAVRKRAWRSATLQAMSKSAVRSARRAAPLLFGRSMASVSFDVGGANRPHPRKKVTEDAHFFSQGHLPGTVALGVADGVGGAADSAWYSANLMSHAEALAQSGLVEPKEILTQAWKLARSQHALDGRSTMCVLVLDARQSTPILRAANLGDSTFWVLRPREGSGRLGIALKMRQQQHVSEDGYSNCPYQLGWLENEEINTPADADTGIMQLRAGDTVVLATDGLWDAMHPLEILEAVAGGLQRGYAAQALASNLVELASELSQDPMRLSPAVESMARQGLVARPREAQDDVTVVVAKVEESRDS